MTEYRRVGLSTGIGMNVALAGPEDAPPAILIVSASSLRRKLDGMPGSSVPGSSSISAEVRTPNRARIVRGAEPGDATSTMNLRPR